MIYPDVTLRKRIWVLGWSRVAVIHLQLCKKNISRCKRNVLATCFGVCIITYSCPWYVFVHFDYLIRHYIHNLPSAISKQRKCISTFILTRRSDFDADLSILLHLCAGWRGAKTFKYLLSPNQTRAFLPRPQEKV